MTTTLTPPPSASGLAASAAEAAAASVLATPAVRGVRILATTLAGMSAGFFFTYQISVIRGLAIVDDETYVRTFQAVNATIRSAPFAVVFFGTVPALILALVLHRQASRSIRGLLTLAVVAAIATVLITFVGNVPLNEELALITNVDPATAADARAAFESDWNRLNLIRTVTSIVAAMAVAAAASCSKE